MAYGLFLKDELTSSCSKIGTSPLFYFSPSHEEKKRHTYHLQDRGIRRFRKGGFYKHRVPTIDGLTPPPYKDHFKNNDLVFDKPILTVLNKSSIEWNKGLFNYFDSDSLNYIFDTFYSDYQIIYIRPPYKSTKSFQHDAVVKTVDIGDIDLINKSYPEIITMEDLLDQFPGKTYNELQMMSLANSDKHICSAGGEAAISSYFGGDVLIYRHPTAKSCNRKVWHTDSYLKRFSGANIYGYDNEKELVDNAIKLWS
jgi:hypothetical protein